MRFAAVEKLFGEIVKKQKPFCVKMWTSAYVSGIISITANI